MDSETDKQVTFFRFEDLRVYHKALDYIDWVTRKVSMFPDYYQHTVARSFYSAAQAIAFNIAEGSSRNKSQFIYYLKMAKSSVRECVVFSSLAESLQCLSEQETTESRGQLMELTKMIGALIGSLQRSSDYSDDDQD